MVCGQPGAPCVQNIVHSKPGVWHGFWCVGQGANCVQIVAGVGGQAGPTNVHCGFACVWQGANCVQIVAGVGGQPGPKNVHCGCAWVGQCGPLCVQPPPGPAAASCCGSDGQLKKVQSPFGIVWHPPNCEQATKSDAGQPTGVNGSGCGPTARAAKACAPAGTGF